jgi:predicted small metal-binding protein
MLNVSCREVGMDCDYVCKGQTEEEIMKNAGEHAVRDHGYKEEDLMTLKYSNKAYTMPYLVILQIYYVIL